MTPTITIREAVPDDAQALLDFVAELSAEPDLYIPMAPGELNMTLEDERAFVERHAARDNSLLLVADNPDPDDPRHAVGILNISGHHRVALRHTSVLGLSIRKGFRGRGLGREMMARAVEWARGRGKAMRIELRVYAENAPAIALYERFGFVREGVCRNAAFQRGRFYDDHIMALVLDGAAPIPPEP